MPLKKHLYPKNWKYISFFVRFVIAKGRCQACNAEHGKPHPITGKKVALTTAHINHDPNGDADKKIDFNNLSSFSHLRAWCQRCHLGYDRRRNTLIRTKKKCHPLPQLF